MNTTDHPHKKVLEFLSHHRMGILSTVSPEGTPWGSAIFYLVDEDFTFYFVTRAETLKYQNLKSNSQVALTIADEEMQTTVQLRGNVTPLPYKDYMEVVFRKFPQIKPTDDASWQFPIDKLHDSGNYMPLVLKPEKLQYADYKHAKTDNHTDFIEQIIQ